MLHQYIRQQANELAAARAAGYYHTPAVPSGPRGEQQTQDPQPKDDTQTPGKAPQKGEKSSDPRQNNEPRGQEGILPKGWREQFGLPSGGGSGLPPGGRGGGPPDDGGGDDGEAEEEEGDETDEDTISVTESSTPGEPERGRDQGGSPGGGVLQKTQIISQGGSRTPQEGTPWT